MIFLQILTLVMQLVPKIMHEYSLEQRLPLYYLVESNICPDDSDGFKTLLQDGEPFKSDFIGASKEQCQNWALEQYKKYNFIEQNLIVIADQRSAQDQTLLVSFYYPEVCPEEPTLEFDDWGPLPPKANVWYDFRVHHRGIDEIYTSLLWAPQDSAYATYFGRPEKFIDEAGVFDVFKANSYVCGDDLFDDT